MTPSNEPLTWHERFEQLVERTSVVARSIIRKIELIDIQQFASKPDAARSIVATRTVAQVFRDLIADLPAYGEDVRAAYFEGALQAGVDLNPILGALQWLDSYADGVVNEVPFAGLATAMLRRAAVERAAVAGAVFKWAPAARDHLRVDIHGQEVLDRLSGISERAQAAYVEEVANQLAAAEQLAREASNTATTAEEAAGRAARATLSQDFAAMVHSESRVETVFRAAAILTALATGASAYFVELPVHTSATDVLRHYAYVVPALLLAGYFAREAADHRRVALWARTITVQLQTAPAYAASLPTELGERLLETVGHLALTDRSPGNIGKDEDLISLVKRLIEMVRETR